MWCAYVCRDYGERYSGLGGKVRGVNLRWYASPHFLGVGLIGWSGRKSPGKEQ